MPLRLEIDNKLYLKWMYIEEFLLETRKLCTYFPKRYQITQNINNIHNSHWVRGTLENFVGEWGTLVPLCVRPGCIQHHMALTCLATLQCVTSLFTLCSR